MMENAWELRSHWRQESSRKRLSTPIAYAARIAQSQPAEVVDLVMTGEGDTEVESVGTCRADSEREWSGHN